MGVELKEVHVHSSDAPPCYDFVSSVEPTLKSRVQAVGVAFAVLALFLGCAFAYSSVQCTGDHRYVDSFSHSLPSDTEFTKFVLHSSYGNIHIETSEDYDSVGFKVDANVGSSAALAAARNSLAATAVDDDGVLSLVLGTPRDTDSNSNSNSNSNSIWADILCPDVVDVTVELPASLSPNATYEIRGSHGELTVRGMSGNIIDMETHDMDIDMNPVVTGELTVDTYNGSLTITNGVVSDWANLAVYGGSFGATSMDVTGPMAVQVEDGSASLFTVSADLVRATATYNVYLDKLSAPVCHFVSTTGHINGNAKLDKSHSSSSSSSVYSSTSFPPAGYTEGRLDSIMLSGPSTPCRFVAIAGNGHVRLKELVKGGGVADSCAVIIDSSNGFVEAILSGFNGDYSATAVNGTVATHGHAAGGVIGSGSGSDAVSFLAVNGNVVFDERD